VSDAVRHLADLAEEEIGLIAAGRTDALADLQERRAVALAALPGELSPADRAELGRVHQLHVQITSLLQAAVTETAAHLARLDRGHTALRGYADALKRA
jgi:hypothetical protein